MNVFRCASGLQKWLLIATLCVVVSGCNEPASQDQTPKQAQEQVGDGVILANDDGTMPEIQGVVATTAVRISPPRDRSTFPSPGPDLGAIDTTACNSCHSPGDVAEFNASPQQVRLELVNEQCRDCHSADYTSSQPIMTRPAWQKVVVKMADKFGANRIKHVVNGVVTDHPHQAVILDYIVAVYGKQP